MSEQAKLEIDGKVYQLPIVVGTEDELLPIVDQVLSGTPITITDPDMTRFMMTLDDAVDLVLYAFQHGESGDIFVQKAPAATIATSNFTAFSPRTATAASTDREAPSARRRRLRSAGWRCSGR